ncbi:MAG: Gfo/Idh/MocA family oxidoreductase, partial [Actinobacteria bacterium]|nr:Gfo/Idh/MocA family oxidoreductase [Actinomycetota bacterium]
MAATYRVALIGRTGRGNYGHYMDRAWRLIPNAEVVAVADPDATGRSAAMQQSGAARSYTAFDEMLRQERPDIVGVCPRYPDCHEEMILAAIDAGARGVYCEKPFVRTLAEADRVIHAAEAAGVKIQVMHSGRLDPSMRHARALVKKGVIGALYTLRAYGKSGARGGGQDLMVLGVHMMDNLRQFAGDPLAVSAEVLQSGRDVGPRDIHAGDEEIGLIAGNQIIASYLFEHGVVGVFDSREGAPEQRAGLDLVGSEGLLTLRGGLGIYRRPYVDVTSDLGWERIPVPDSGDGLGAKPAVPEDRYLHA